jgi:hypothetical protein
LADAVEKVDVAMPKRNNRIGEADILNRSCAFDAYLESILLQDPLKIFFRQHWPVCDMRPIENNVCFRVNCGRDLLTVR